MCRPNLTIYSSGASFVLGASSEFLSSNTILQAMVATDILAVSLVAVVSAGLGRRPWDPKLRPRWLKEEGYMFNRVYIGVIVPLK